MLYLITGGAGFIGSHLAWSLAKRGERVRLLDNFDTGSRESVRALLNAYPNTISIVEGDIRDGLVCRDACNGADYVLHHAAIASVPRSIEDPVECAEVNIGGTVNLLAAARAAGSVRRLIFASSSAVYGDLPGLCKNESDPLDPLSPYAGSKLAGEHFCRSYARLLELETVSFRYFNVYGVRQNPNGAYAAVIPKFIQAISEFNPPVVYGDGSQVRDFINVEDVVRANLLACTSEASSVSGRVFNIASGTPTSLNELLSELARISGRPVDARYEPARPGDILRSTANIENARIALGFEPSISIHGGLASVFHSYMVPITGAAPSNRL